VPRVSVEQFIGILVKSNYRFAMRKLPSLYRGHCIEMFAIILHVPTTAFIAIVVFGNNR